MLYIQRKIGGRQKKRLSKNEKTGGKQTKNRKNKTKKLPAKHGEFSGGDGKKRRKFNNLLILVAHL